LRGIPFSAAHLPQAKRLKTMQINEFVSLQTGASLQIKFRLTPPKTILERQSTMTTLHATPYNIDAVGFYFESLDEYIDKSSSLLDRFGNVVEEFEIQFIDGENAQLFIACGINQSNLKKWFEEIECLEDYEQLSLFVLLSAGYNLENAMDKLDEPCISECSLKDAATELFDECYAGSIPENLKSYIDYDAFARDVEIGGDMVEFEYNHKTYTCTNASGI
jgi:hypothetical protein